MKKLLFIFALLLGVMSCKSDQEDLYTDGNRTTFMFDKLSVHFDAKGGQDSISIGNPTMIKHEKRTIKFVEFMTFDKDKKKIDYYIPEPDLVNRDGIKVYFRPEAFDFMIEAEPSEDLNKTYYIKVASNCILDYIVIKR